MYLKTTLFVLCVLVQLASNAQYYPPNGKNWKEKSLQELKLSGTAIQKAVDFARANEYKGSKDLRVAILKGFSHEPYHRLTGPTKERGGPAGIILKNGFIVAKWGDIDRVDMTFSVSKSYLSTVVGLAVHDGLITDIHDKVIDYVWDGTFAGVHNGKITWEHLLTQSSDWSGELFGMHDWADRPPLNGTIDDWKKREIKEPGTSFEYNDVRVNVLSYSLLQVWRKSLPTVLKDRIMDPIGASTTWRWYGYENSWVNIDGQKIQSVSGGGHSGGGVFISARDQARFGLLLLRKGKWNDQQLLSVSWINAMKQPSKANESYGFMWWLNKGKYKLRNIDNEDLYYAAGFGGNYIVIDEKNELVVVTRWLEPSKMNEFMMLIQEALK